ncbi:hypothetical protein B0H12DRAFT_1246116 [Mycena haematopus]|nr:hypothetical protein B0H12DRAFT_1246116 [Mycena haematopus]
MPNPPRRVKVERGTQKLPRRPLGDKENAVAPPTQEKDLLTTGNFEAFYEQLEKRFNIDGSNYLDVVYQRIENDEAQAKLTAQAAELEALTRQLEALKATGHSGAKSAGDIAMTSEQQARTDEMEHVVFPQDVSAAEEDMIMDGDKAMADVLARENAELRKLLAAARAAGAQYNIRDAMGLGKSALDGEKFKGIQRNLRDLTLQAGVNWEKPWGEISAEVKGKLFAVARERHPILARFHNDWATEDIIKQFIKNKRNNAYRNNWLEVPAKFAYLKDNSAKRDPSAPRGRKNKLEKVKTARKAQVVKKKVSGSRAKSSSKSSSSGTNKGKGRAKPVASSEDEDAEMTDYEAKDAMDEDDD